MRDAICYNWLWHLMGHNFGCMIASDTQFDSRGGFSRSSYPTKTESRLSVKRSLPWQPILGLKLLLTGFVWTIVTRQLVMKGVLSGRRQNAGIADTLHLRDVAMATTFCLSMGYNFSCMTASNTLFDSRVGFLGSSYPMKTQPISVF